MILLIDGYNLLKSVSFKVHVSEQTVHEFTNKLNSYCKKKGHKAIVVFDGGIHSFPTKQNQGQILVVYSGYKESADDVIKDYLSKKENLLLVSSDRDLQKYASKFNFNYISSLEFYKFISKNDDEKPHKIKSSDIVHKTTSESNKELDKLMNEAFNVDIKKDSDIIYNSKNEKTNKLSKKERRLKQKIRKL